MDKFDQQRIEIQKMMEEKLAKIDEAQKLHQRRVVKPLASKFSALIAEELEKLGADNLEKIEAYKFSKAQVRERLRTFLHGEFQTTDKG